MKDPSQPHGGERAPPDVLIVDDDPKAASILRIYLEHAGLKTAVASGGEEGLRQLREAPAKLLILDLLMPRVTGFDVIETLAHDADPALRAIPVIVVSSLPLAAGDIAALGPQVREVLFKTEFRFEQLIARVRQLLPAS